MHDSYWRARCACAILAALLLAACGRADGPAAQGGSTPTPASPAKAIALAGRPQKRRLAGGPLGSGPIDHAL